MSSHEKDKNQGPEDKDYGFPFVEVTPLVEPQASSQEKETVAPVTKEDKKSSQISVDKGLIKPTVNTSRKAKRQSPVLFSLVLLIVVILGVMAYFLYYQPTAEQRVSQSDTAAVSDLPVAVEEENTEEPQAMEMESDQEEIEIEAETLEDILNPNISPERSNATGTIETVQAPAERPVYHIIVGSMPNERLAREEAEKLLQKGKNLYLLMPHGDTRNYRLSIGSFGTFSSASQALDEAKKEFDDSIWILKY